MFPLKYTTPVSRMTEIINQLGIAITGMLCTVIMKVELDNIRLGVTALTDSIHAGIPDKDNHSFKHSKVVTSDFIKCLIDWCGNSRRTISGGGKYWEITVKEIKI